MAVEIERKFLVKNHDYRHMAVGSTRIMQGYLSTEIRATIRVRLCGDNAYLTVKGANIGSVRDEWEYEIPVDDAMRMLERCAAGAVIDKERYRVPHEGHMWEVDEFHGHYEGLVVAEVELSDENEEVAIPDFVGKEVTGNTRYYNSVMASATTHCAPARELSRAGAQCVVNGRVVSPVSPVLPHSPHGLYAGTCLPAVSPLCGTWRRA